MYNLIWIVIPGFGAGDGALVGFRACCTTICVCVGTLDSIRNERSDGRRTYYTNSYYNNAACERWLVDVARCTLDYYHWTDSCVEFTSELAFILWCAGFLSVADAFMYVYVRDSKGRSKIDSAAADSGFRINT